MTAPNLTAHDGATPAQACLRAEAQFAFCQWAKDVGIREAAREMTRQYYPNSTGAQRAKHVGFCTDWLKEAIINADRAGKPYVVKNGSVWVAGFHVGIMPHGFILHSGPAKTHNPNDADALTAD